MLTATSLHSTYIYDHTSPVLKELQWLPVYLSIEYKGILIKYKSFNDPAH